MSLGQQNLVKQNGISPTWLIVERTPVAKRFDVKKSLHASVTLTSLVDVFTILVVYLLVTTSTGIDEIKTVNGLTLPTASLTELIKTNLSVYVKDGQYYFLDRVVSVHHLSDLLKKERNGAEAIIIQADKKASYAELNPIVLSGLQAGFTKISFAVLQEDKI